MTMYKVFCDNLLYYSIQVISSPEPKAQVSLSMPMLSHFQNCILPKAFGKSCNLDQISCVASCLIGQLERLH